MRVDVFHKLWEMLSKYGSWKDPLPAVKYPAGALLPKLYTTLASRVRWKGMAAAQPAVLQPLLVQVSCVNKSWLCAYVRVNSSLKCLQSQCIFGVFLEIPYYTAILRFIMFLWNTNALKRFKTGSHTHKPRKTHCVVRVNRFLSKGPFLALCREVQGRVR